MRYGNIAQCGAFGNVRTVDVNLAGDTCLLSNRTCQKAGVPCQVYTNRSDIAGGSTLGNISNTQVSMRAVDIGMPQLAMHSPYEMAGAKDTFYLKEAARQFYSSTILFEEDGTIQFA